MQGWPASFYAKFLPKGVDLCFHLSVHGEHGGPGAGEAFGRPLARGVDTHLAAVVRETACVVERVDGAQGELDVALGVDVVGDAQGDLREVLDVAVFVDDDDAL